MRRTSYIIGLFTSFLNSNLLQIDGRPGLDCVYSQLPLDGAIGAVFALRRAPPEFIMN